MLLFGRGRCDACRAIEGTAAALRNGTNSTIATGIIAASGPTTHRSDTIPAFTASATDVQQHGESRYVERGVVWS